MPEPWLGLASRRDFVRTSGGAIGWTALVAHFPVASAAAREARRIASGELPRSLVVLSPSEAAEVEEISAIIIPTDDTPGAREAGAVYFIDRALAGFLSPLAPEFRAGLADFSQRLAASHENAASIAALDAAEVTSFLRSVQDTEFFNLCWTLTAWGTFADPTHGGNRDQAGWSILGFEDRHAWWPPFGYYDRDAHGGDR